MHIPTGLAGIVQKAKQNAGLAVKPIRRFSGLSLA
jgi:hypothetical protein